MEKLPAPEIPPWLARHVPFERYRLKAGDKLLHVMETGAGRPVLMLHGNPTWGFLYRKVAAELRDAGLRLIMPDLVGLGFSEKPRDPAAHTLRAHASWIGALIDQLELRDLVFVGQDWGGPIGLRALADRPKLVHGLVILNTVVGPPQPGFRPTAFHRFARAPVVSDFAFRVIGFPLNTLHTVQGDRSSIRGEVARAYRYPLRHMRDRVAPLALARMVPDGLEHESVRELEQCQAFVDAFSGPSAIVWGERDPILGRVRRRIERALPEARVTVTQAGHFLQEEVPKEIADAIRFVARECGDYA